MPEGTDVFEIIHSTRAMRRLKPDPVPDELIRNILLAGQAAASGGNTQRWRFLVLKDPEIKKKVQVYYKKAFDEVVGPRYASSAPPPGSDAAKYNRQHRAVEYLTDHYHERQYGSSPASRTALFPVQDARRGPRSIPPSRTCCSRRGRSGSARP